jgi:hypothetical protein
MTDDAPDHDVRAVLPRDAIPSVDDPSFRSVEAFEGGDRDAVVAVAREGEARAYPVRYLHYHEVVNDAFPETPLAVTWCPLCGSAVVYDRRVDGETRTFGVSGKLADDDLVMYDRETASEWKQSSGVCLSGPSEGRRLDVLPAATTTVGAFREAHPDGVVLDPPGGESEAASDTDDPAPVDYDADPYESYFETEGFGLGAHRGTGGRDDWPDRLAAAGLDPKSVVVGLEADGDAVGVALPTVESAGGVLRVDVGGTTAVVFSTPDGVHAFEALAFEFRPTDDEGTFRGGGTAWNGATGAAADGRRLRRLPARRLFAFAWRDDHGVDAFLGV